MGTNLKKIEDEALRLPLKDRARLAECLIASLDETADPEGERLWLMEAEKRYQEYREGKIQGKPARDVFHKAFSEMK